MPEDERLNKDMKKIRETVTGSKNGDSYYSDEEEVELSEEGEREKDSKEDPYYDGSGETVDPEEYRKNDEESSESQEEVVKRPTEEERPVSGEESEKEDEKTVRHEKEIREEKTEKDDRKEESLMGDIPEPPTTKKIEIPDIETGPLFIRVEKFKKAKKMVNEMHEMDDDLKTKMAGLKSTLEEDKNINKNVFEVLRDLQDSMNSIKNIVSPDQK